MPSDSIQEEMKEYVVGYTADIPVWMVPKCIFKSFLLLYSFRVPLKNSR